MVVFNIFFDIFHEKRVKHVEPPFIDLLVKFPTLCGYPFPYLSVPFEKPGYLFPERLAKDKEADDKQNISGQEDKQIGSMFTGGRIAKEQADLHQWIRQETDEEKPDADFMPPFADINRRGRYRPPKPLPKPFLCLPDDGFSEEQEAKQEGNFSENTNNRHKSYLLRSRKSQQGHDKKGDSVNNIQAKKTDPDIKLPFFPCLIHIEVLRH
jgi:hypothetical protein